MRKRMKDGLSFRCDTTTREAIERIAVAEERAIAEVARDLLNEGMKARGIS